MALINCSECGKKVSDMASNCPNCGHPIHQSTEQKVDDNFPRCPKCGSNNVSFQREQTASFGGSKTSIKKGHGIMYWIFIGWWLSFFKAMLAIGTLGISTLFLRKKKTSANTLNASKQFNRTMAVCQHCGNSWKVK